MIPLKVINRYELLNNVADDDVFLIVHNNETYNVNGKTLMTYVKNHPEISSLYATKTELSNNVSTLNKVLTTETNRAKSAESANASNISSEISRAKAQEETLNTAIATSEKNSKKYTDTKIANLINGAPETMDTLKEVSDAIASSRTVEEALNKAIGTKALQTDFDAHTSNMKVHITNTERENLNDANSKKHTHSNKSVLDGISSALITAWNNAVEHISDTVKHITPSERALLNTVSNKVDKVKGKGLSTNDYTTEEKNKLKGISANANNYSLPTATSSVLGGVKIGNNISNENGTLSLSKDNIVNALGYEPGASGTSVVIGVKGNAEDTYRTGKINLTPKDLGAATEVHTHTKSQIIDFPTAMPASDVYGWAKQETKPTYTASEVGAANATHTHTVVNGHTVNSDVPANAKFTDTWRGIQDSLTSTSKTDSLSANQGKVLKHLLDNKRLIQTNEPTSQSVGDEWLSEY